jgi:hypothetical protein
MTKQTFILVVDEGQQINRHIQFNCQSFDMKSEHEHAQLQIEMTID